MTDKAICNKIIKFWIPDNKYHAEWFKHNPLFDKYIYDSKKDIFFPYYLII